MSTSIAQQTTEELGGPASVLARQRRDHEELDDLLQQLAHSSGDGQEAVLQRIWRLVFSHAFAEEAVLWPAVRRSLSDGEDLTLRIEQEHQEINRLVTELEEAGPDDPLRQVRLDRIVALLVQDVRDEEDLVLPRLQEALDPAALRRLGRSWEAVRRTAPTRPHPTVARRPVGNVLAALPLTVLDRSRDVLDRTSRRGPGRRAGAARAASAALATAAGAVERFPPFRIGEDRSTRTH